MQEYKDPEKQTQIGPKTTYWFWLGVTCFNAAFGFLLLMLQLEKSLLVAWISAIVAAVIAGWIHYIATKEQRAKIANGGMSMSMKTFFKRMLSPSGHQRLNRGSQVRNQLLGILIGIVVGYWLWSIGFLPTP